MAVDPTSPRSGGALLGDRIRLQHLFLMRTCFLEALPIKVLLGLKSNFDGVCEDLGSSWF